MNALENSSAWGVSASGLCMTWVVTSEGLRMRWIRQESKTQPAIVEIDALRQQAVLAA